MSVDYSLTLVADADFLKRIAVPGTAGRDLLGIVDAAVQGGVTVVQLRAKALPFREFLDLGLKMADRLAGTGVPLIINDRMDVALACGADGVHLGQDDMPLAAARKILGGDRIIGISVNTAVEALAAEAGGADYVGAAPAFATATKEIVLPVLGPEGIRSIKRAVRIPVVAIGGISAANAADIQSSGADGIAVISAILGAPDARRATEDLRKAFKR